MFTLTALLVITTQVQIVRTQGRSMKLPNDTHIIGCKHAMEQLNSRRHHGAKGCGHPWSNGPWTITYSDRPVNMCHRTPKAQHIPKAQLRSRKAPHMGSQYRCRIHQLPDAAPIPAAVDKLECIDRSRSKKLHQQKEWLKKIESRPHMRAFNRHTATHSTIAGVSSRCRDAALHAMKRTTP